VVVTMPAIFEGLATRTLELTSFPPFICPSSFTEMLSLSQNGFGREEDAYGSRLMHNCLVRRDRLLSNDRPAARARRVGILPVTAKGPRRHYTGVLRRPDSPPQPIWRRSRWSAGILSISPSERCGRHGCYRKVPQHRNAYRTPRPIRTDWSSRILDGPPRGHECRLQTFR
jgi:hypothetical protein